MRVLQSGDGLCWITVSLACSRAAQSSVFSTARTDWSLAWWPGSFRVIIWIIKDNYCYKHSAPPSKNDIIVISSFIISACSQLLPRKKSEINFL